ncbi:MAG TPA: UxaA family hydrolase [Paraburkholderia sp.]|uniref:UxaA family hydrolase n=1 Tax=Paraburkholderia sp. TaxID=1926495 RepID=UPI002D1367DA|nr:UxaA family hydrolase [Paraburkholderia sp.]HTR10842.1 UxaA family hydrolase [Paraburkholderia sp.]
MIHAVLHESEDTVGVAVVEGIKAGVELNAWIMDDDKLVTIVARQEIPIGHKVALKDMAVGDTVYKYGIDIGQVVAPIKAGEHAHVHNVKTKRW